jgi:hypothetical protein
MKKNILLKFNLLKNNFITKNNKSLLISNIIITI